ncbi:MAG TPA: glycoside hydrolase family 31 protein, partial [Chitinophagaceae bacterium]|nr:glycoside hydrolase family 31 protein [Chitinophagaceae bacterium]
KVNKNPFQLQVFDRQNQLLVSDYKDQGHIHKGAWLATYKSLQKDEQFYGLGEKAGILNRKGNQFKMWNSDNPCYDENTDPLYKSIPFFMSNKHYGIFFDNTYKTEFRFGSENPDCYSMEAPAGEMIYYVMAGADYKDIISQYTALTGKPILPPKWAFGFSQCRGSYTNESLARSVAAEFRKRQIPCDIIFQDIGWVDELQNFDWNKSRYANARGMLRDLNAQGYKVVVSQDPVISQRNSKQWKEADSLHYFTTDSRTGTSYDMPWPWGGNCGVVDFTNPKVAGWWGQYQQKPIDDGVSGFWTDMGEPAWSNEDSTNRLFMQHHLGMHDEIHNVYGLTWDKVVKEEFEKRNPNKRIFQMTRSAFAGLQRYTFGWSGDSGNGDDVLQGWKRLAGQIPVGLSAGMGLIPFWSCDISGYCGNINDYPAFAELYTRWMQFGVFNPISRAHHEGDNAAEPWLFGQEVENYCRAAIEQKYKLFPYIYTYAREAYDKGWPLMRAMLLEFPKDPEAVKQNGEFMFGSALLVAPVVEQGAREKRVYFPEGDWINLHHPKEVYKGKQYATVKAPISEIPVFVKKGSVIPMMPVMQYIHEQNNYLVYFSIYPAAAGKSASFTLYEDDGLSLDYKNNDFRKTSISCKSLKKSYQISISKASGTYRNNEKRNFVIQIHCNSKPSQILIDGNMVMQATSNGKGTVTKDPLWNWDAQNGLCSITMQDDAQAHAITVKH